MIQKQTYSTKNTVLLSITSWNGMMVFRNILLFAFGVHYQTLYLADKIFLGDRVGRSVADSSSADSNRQLTQITGLKGRKTTRGLRTRVMLRHVGKYCKRKVK